MRKILLVIGILLLMLLSVVCKKQPTIYDPDGWRDEVPEQIQGAQT